MMEEIKNCPFCGSDRVAVVNSFVRDSSFIECDGCGAEGPGEPLGTKTFDKWNKRVNPIEGKG
jgi:Lar family restriction alleviation protein